MQKLNAKKLIDFQNRSKASRKTFADNLKKPAAPKDGGGGDYWIPATSAICNAWKFDDASLIDEKIEGLKKLIKETERTQTQDMYKRNIAMLSGFKRFDLASIKPKVELHIMHVPKTTELLVIKGLPVQVLPSYVFTYKNKSDGDAQVGAVWFVAYQHGYKKEELGVFAELAYRFLSANYAKGFSVNTSNCIVVDVMRANELRYKNVTDPKVDLMISELKKFL
jgi:hypothetical protein